MIIKDYAIGFKELYEPFIEIILNDNLDKDNYVIKMWGGYFNEICRSIPLNEDEMYVGLAYHYHVDTPWQEQEDEPWEIDNLKLWLHQIKQAENILKRQAQDDTELQICKDICIVLEKAIQQKRKVFIIYHFGD